MASGRLVRIRGPAADLVDEPKGAPSALDTGVESVAETGQVDRRSTLPRFAFEGGGGARADLPVRTERRIRLGLVDIDSRQWMAGGVYLRNLVYALASLPNDERPDIQLLGGAGRNSALSDEIRRLGFRDGSRRAVEIVIDLKKAIRSFT